MSVEYLKEGEEKPSRRHVEPYSIERRLPHWYVHTWDRTSGGERSFRLDRMRSARLLKEEFTPRPGFDPGALRDARFARILYSPAVARWQVERGARLLADGSALAETPVGSPEWLVGEILSFRGEATVLEPDDLRSQIAARAKELGSALRPASRARAGSASRS